MWRTHLVGTMQFVRTSVAVTSADSADHLVLWTHHPRLVSFPEDGIEDLVGYQVTVFQDRE